MIASLGVGGDLHAENDHEQCKCPRGITQCLGRSKSHTIGRPRVIGAVPLQNRLSWMAMKRFDMNNDIIPEPQLCKALHDRERQICQHRWRSRHRKVIQCSGFQGIATFIEMRRNLIGSKSLTHIVHLYGRLLHKTSNSKLVINTVSQLRLVQINISTWFPAYEDKHTCRYRQWYGKAWSKQLGSCQWEYSDERHGEHGTYYSLSGGKDHASWPSCQHTPREGGENACLRVSKDLIYRATEGFINHDEASSSDGDISLGKMPRLAMPNHCSITLRSLGFDVWAMLKPVLTSWCTEC